VRGEEKLAPLVREINWAHNIVIFEKCKDDLEREFYLNRPIGIVLCRAKNTTIVEYALAGLDQPLGVATYALTAQLPERLREELPDAAQIARLLGEL